MSDEHRLALPMPKEGTLSNGMVFRSGAWWKKCERQGCDKAAQVFGHCGWAENYCSASCAIEDV